MPIHSASCSSASSSPPRRWRCLSRSASACLVLHGEPEQLMLQQRVASDASSDEFEAGLANFLNALTRWHARTGAL